MPRIHIEIAFMWMRVYEHACMCVHVCVCPLLSHKLLAMAFAVMGKALVMKCIAKED